MSTMDKSVCEATEHADDNLEVLCFGVFGSELVKFLCSLLLAELYLAMLSFADCFLGDGTNENQEGMYAGESGSSLFSPTGHDARKI